MHLRKLDRVLYEHLVALNIQPELILIKWLKCLLSRDFDLPSLLHIWDYLLSGFDPLQRVLTDSRLPQIDQLKNLDYLCIAMIQFSRARYLEGDHFDCLQIAMKPLELESAEEIVELAEFARRRIVPAPGGYPKVVEEEVRKYRSKRGLLPHQAFTTQPHLIIPSHKKELDDLSFQFEDGSLTDHEEEPENPEASHATTTLTFNPSMLKSKLIFDQ